MRWLLTTWLEHDPSPWRDIRWPSRAQFAVPAALVRTRPRLLYALLAELLAADLEAPAEARAPWEGVGGAARLRRADEAPALLHVWSPEPVGKRWSSLQWAHSLERLWFPLFDPYYSPYKHKLAANSTNSSAAASAARTLR
jgi:hypothetical protein